MYNTIYLEKLLNLKKNLSVKLITGCRGVGKTTLLKMFANYLKNNGVSDKEIIFIDFERETILDFNTLYEYISKKVAGLENAYILLDEIDSVENWEKAVIALFTGLPVEIYATGADERVLTQKMKKLLTDNCDVLEMYPLSFAEFLKVQDNEKPSEESFEKFTNFGSMSFIVEENTSEETKKRLLNGICYETFFRDAVIKHSLRDADLFRGIVYFLAKHIGQPIRTKNIVEYFKSINKKVTIFTVDNYLNIIDKIGILRKIHRYDVNEEKILNGGENFYCVDTGILNALSNFEGVEKIGLIKNLVVSELLRNGYEVRVAKLGAMNIDFMAVSKGKKIYIQVLPDDNSKTITELLRPLHKLSAETEKILISSEPLKIKGNVKNITITDFLLNYFVKK